MKNFLMSCIAVSFLTPFVRADITQRQNVVTQDGTTCNTYPYSVIYPNSACTDNGNGTVSINIAGGGGGSSTLAVSAGVVRSSPTTDVIFPSSEFVGAITNSSTMTVTLNTSSVTLQGPIVSSITLNAMYGAPTLVGTNFTSLPGAQVGSGVPAANIAAGALGSGGPGPIHAP